MQLSSFINSTPIMFNNSKQISFGAKNKMKDIKAQPLTTPELRFRTVGENYRSACPTSLNLGFTPGEIFSEFRKKGITTLIDLRQEASVNSGYKEAVDTFNKSQKGQRPFIYKLFPIEHNNSKFADPICKNGEIPFLKKLGELIGLMNNGGCNVSCGGGLHRTDLFYCLSYIFNPKEVNPPKLSGAFGIQQNINFNIYERILNKIKVHLFNNDKKQTFKFPTVEGLRKMTGIEFDKRLLNIRMFNKF